VIQRSNAWSRLLELQFSEALRLSIHPQPRVSNKIGVFLVAPSDVWRTPWHAVAVRRGGEVVLMPRSEAEAGNALLVIERGRPSHYIQSAPPAAAEKEGA
jgi:pyoverdine/dityrosine biosynthesis protein Dit1